MTWNPFKKKEAAPAEPEQAAAGREADPEAKKGRPTPKRKVAQAETLRPLVPKDRKASKEKARDIAAEKQDREYAAMKSGDLQHMPAYERIPVRVYIRDYVDARINLMDFFMPIAFPLMIVSMIITYSYPKASTWLMVALWAYILVAIIDTAVMWRKLRKKLIDKFGEKSVARGTRNGFYAWSRTFTIRRFRLPRPRYAKRGHWPE